MNESVATQDVGASDARAADLPLQPWQRFSLFDLLLLFVPIAVAFALVSSFSRESLGRAIYAGAILSTIFIMPIVLAGHYFRGRRSRPSGGEWLALVPWGAFGVGLAMSPFTIGRVSQELFFGLGSVVCFWFWCIAQIVLAMHLLRIRNEVPCRWTDFCGTLFVSLYGWIVIGHLVVFAMLWH